MKRILIIVGIVAAIVLVALVTLRLYTKSFSPEAEARISNDDLEVTVSYCQPGVKGRKIFGELIPYGEVWRTGANEATVFATSGDLQIGDSVLPAGEYSLFTIPGEETWTIIFNSETGQWGVDALKGGKANRDPDKDILQVDVPAIQMEKFFETFTISLEEVGSELELILMWENTMVAVPMVHTNL